MMHDSYGVHACDVDLLNRVLRQRIRPDLFQPVLQNFLDQQRKAHPHGIKRLPDPPKQETSISSRSSRLPTFLPDRRLKASALLLCRAMESCICLGSMMIAY